MMNYKAMYVKEDTKIETIVRIFVLVYVLIKEFQYRIPVPIYFYYNNYYHIFMVSISRLQLSVINKVSSFCPKLKKD